MLSYGIVWCMTKSVSERFWEKVDTSGKCWEWIAYRLQGYGRFGVNGRTVYAHRWSYEQQYGPIPEGLVIDHLCLNKACVRPDHLEAVTPEENHRRYVATITHCPRGHEYTAGNLRFDTYGRRYCRECNIERGRQRTRRIAAEEGRALRQDRTHCKNGHEWTPENTRYRPLGRRECRECTNAAQRRYYARKKAMSA